MKPINFIYRLVFTVLLTSFIPGPSTATTEADNSIHLNVIASGNNETVLEFTVDGFEVETFEQDGRYYQRVVIDDTVQSTNVGEHQVPVFSSMIGLANSEKLSLQVVDQQTLFYRGFNLPFIQEIKTTTDNLLDPHLEVQIITTFGSAETLTDKALPEQPAVISQSGYLRDQGFAQVTFYPVQYNADHQELILNKRIVVKVSSNSVDMASQSGSRGYRPEYENILKNTLVNYMDLHRPVAEPAAAPLSHSESELQTAAAANPNLKITISEEGLYQLTYSQMAAVGFDPSGVASSELKMTNRGTEVAILVEAGENDRIDAAGERILFYGAAINDVYTNKNVYWLTYSAGPGKRMVIQTESPNTDLVPVEFRNLLHAEKDTQYWQTMPGGEGQDHWFWDGKISPNTEGFPEYRNYTVALTNLSLLAGSDANIRFVLKGATDAPFISPDHHTRIYVNDWYKDFYWNGFDILDVNQDIPQNSLINGDNIIQIKSIAVPGVLVDQIYVNWFEIAYRDTYKAENNKLYFHAPSDGAYKFQIQGFTDPSIHVFDVTNPANPVIFDNTRIFSDGGTSTLEFKDSALTTDRFLAVSNSQFLSPVSVSLDSPSSWRTPEHAADYVLITYDEFYNNVQPLANFRIGQGLRVEVVKVQDLYDEFNYGIFNPKAIRDFLTYAYNNWQSPAPLYVLLVGDASIDYKNNLLTDSINFVPTQIVETAALGETPSDNWFVLTAGSDILPDMYIGRLSAQRDSQVDTIVQKIIHYEQEEDPSSWSTGALFVADDGLSNFEEDSDRFASLISAGLTTKKIYAANYPPGDPTLDIIKTINSGAMLVNYLGHGGVGEWGKWGDNDFIFTNADVTSLNNTNKHTFITIESCLNGFFPARQTTYSLAEAFQRVSTGGAVGVWAPSGLSYSNAHSFLISDLYRTFFYKGIYGLGEATTLAKWNVYDLSSYYGDIVKIYVLFGDPATKLGAGDFKIYSLYTPFLNNAP